MVPRLGNEARLIKHIHIPKIICRGDHTAFLWDVSEGKYVDCRPHTSDYVWEENITVLGYPLQGVFGKGDGIEVYAASVCPDGEEGIIVFAVAVDIP